MPKGRGVIGVLETCMLDIVCQWHERCCKFSR